MQKRSRFACLCCVLSLGMAIIAEAADPRKSLEDTVNRFYEAYIQSKWKTAEKYVDRESIEVFRSQPKGGVSRYEIRKIELSEGGQEALVTMGLDTPVPQVGKILTLNAETRWRLSKGKWYVIVGAPPPLTAVMQATSPPPVKPATELRFDYIEHDFGQKRQGDLILVEFPFVNVSDHPVQVTADLVSLCNCIEVKVSKNPVAPGERASVLFRLASTPFTFYYHQGIGIKVEPGGGSMILDIVGFLAPAEYNPPTERSQATP
ncbi:MAG: DUF1573 domain-containing protein [Acidobacteria bacterium]|nr:DUF1573 domain-containing protein [Acidobacteriota bacterium]